MNASTARSDRGTIDGPREWDPDLACGPYSRRRVVAFSAMIVLVLALINLAAHFILPDVPDSRVADRNEFRFRGFPEYLSGLGSAGDFKTLVLLSNSQAYCGEYAAREGYPALLQDLLNNRPASDVGEGKRIEP